MSEAIETQRTVKRSRLPVLLAVGDQVGALTEGFPTDLAHVRLLSSVYESVLLHVGLLVKPLAAVLTGKGPRVRVNEQVSGQSGRTLEKLPTHMAGKHPLLFSTCRPLTLLFTGVDVILKNCVCVSLAHVDPQTGITRKCFITERALQS